MKKANHKILKSVLSEICIKYKRNPEVDAMREKISNSESCYVLMKKLFNSDTIDYSEEFVVVYLNRANNTVGWMQLSKGGISGTVVDVRILLAAGLKSGASGIVMAHNHPTGQVLPSEQDKYMTKKVREACKLIDITLLDHLIITPEKYYSFSDEGLL